MSLIPPIVDCTIVTGFCDLTNVGADAEVGVGCFLCGTGLKTVACCWVFVCGACFDAASAYEWLGTIVPLFRKLHYVVQGCVCITCWIPAINLVMRSKLASRTSGNLHPNVLAPIRESSTW